MSARTLWLALTALAMVPSLAGAHGDIKGLGSFYAGALHPFLVPAHLVALLGLGLLVGQRGLAFGRYPMLALLLALLTGLVASGSVAGFDLERPVLGGAALCALAVVAALPLPRWALFALAALIGAGIGLGSAPEGRFESARWSSLAGTGLGAFLAVIVVGALVDRLRPSWARVGIRIAGSWLAASALLVLALSFVTTPPVRGSSPVAGANAAR